MLRICDVAFEEDDKEKWQKLGFCPSWILGDTYENQTNTEAVDAGVPIPWYDRPTIR